MSKRRHASNLTLLQRLTTIGYALGLRQIRCVHCLRPFIPPLPYEASAPSIHKHLPYGLPLCPKCYEKLGPYTGPRCPRCGNRPENPQDGTVICGACLQNPPPWDGIGFYGLYAGILRHLLLRFKFDTHLYLGPMLGNFLLEAAGCLPRPDMLVAVPQHPAHLKQRGYNQAHELAKALHNISDLPLDSELLTRPVPGPTQAGLPARKRHGNVRHSFTADKKTRGRHIWLVDDIMTTGSTLAAAALALRAAGAIRVDVVFVARTPARPGREHFQGEDLEVLSPCGT